MKRPNPSDLAQLPHLEVRVRQVVEGMLAGLHASPHRGHSLEFAQHRSYTAGDELRHIDWKVFGRSDRFFVKQYQDETNLRATLLVDASGSMAYASAGNPSKGDYAAFLAAAIACTLLHQEDAVGCAVFGDALRSHLPPNHQLAHLSRICDQLRNSPPSGETAIPSLLAAFGSMLKKRGLVILISDLFDDPAALIAALRHFRARRHGVMVIQVLDPEELRLGFSGERLFTHPEGSERIAADADEIRAVYRGLMEDFTAAYRTGFRQAGIDYHLVTTDTPPEKALVACLAKNN